MALFSLVSLAVSAVGAFGAAKQAKKANKANRAAAANEKEIRDIRNLQAKRKFLKDFRLQQAAAIAGAGAVEGGLDSSRAQGQTAASITQAKVGVAEQNKLGELDAEAVANAAQAQKYRNRAAAIGTVTGLATSALNTFGGPPTDKIPTITETDIPADEI